MHFCWHCGMCQCVALYLFIVFINLFSVVCFFTNCSVALRLFFYFGNRQIFVRMDCLMRKFWEIYILYNRLFLFVRIKILDFFFCNYNQLATFQLITCQIFVKLFLNNVIKFVMKIITIILCLSLVCCFWCWLCVWKKYID